MLSPACVPSHLAPHSILKYPVRKALLSPFMAPNKTRDVHSLEEAESGSGPSSRSFCGTVLGSLGCLCLIRRAHSHAGRVHGGPMGRGARPTRDYPPAAVNPPHHFLDPAFLTGSLNDGEPSVPLPVTSGIPGTPRKSPQSPGGLHRDDPLSQPSLHSAEGEAGVQRGAGTEPHPPVHGRGGKAMAAAPCHPPVEGASPTTGSGAG